MNDIALGEPAPIVARPTLTNMRLGLSTMLAAQDAGPDSTTRIGVLHGPSGYGKTVAAATVAARMQAVYVSAKAVTTVKSLLEDIAFEQAIADRSRTVSRLFDQVVGAFRRDPVPLILDEMDYLVKKQIVDVIRDIHDATSIPIMLIGMEALPAKLKAWEQFDNRIVASTQALPASFDDAAILREYYCLHVRIADDLLREIVGATKGITRRVVTALSTVQARALDDGHTDVDLAWWKAQRGTLPTGDLPSRRRLG